MSFRLPRFTVRWLMAAVVAAALILWADRMIKLSAEYRERATKYEYLASLIRSRGEPTEDPLYTWAKRTAAKYERASRYPWLPVEPDEPETLH
jgi:hypothetical protein